MKRPSPKPAQRARGIKRLLSTLNAAARQAQRLGNREALRAVEAAIVDVRQVFGSP